MDGKNTAAPQGAPSATYYQPFGGQLVIDVVFGLAQRGAEQQGRELPVTVRTRVRGPENAGVFGILAMPCSAACWASRSGFANSTRSNDAGPPEPRPYHSPSSLALQNDDGAGGKGYAQGDEEGTRRPIPVSANHRSPDDAPACDIRNENRRLAARALFQGEPGLHNPDLGRPARGCNGEVQFKTRSQSSAFRSIRSNSDAVCAATHPRGCHSPEEGPWEPPGSSDQKKCEHRTVSLSSGGILKKTQRGKRAGGNSAGSSVTRSSGSTRALEPAVETPGSVSKRARTEWGEGLTAGNCWGHAGKAAAVANCGGGGGAGSPPSGGSLESAGTASTGRLSLSSQTSEWSRASTISMEKEDQRE